MDHYGQGQAANALTTAKGSRINSDVERLLHMVKCVHEARERVMRHTQSLGYYADTPPEPGNGKVQPIANNLSNALGDLDHALDMLSGSLNLFD